MKETEISRDEALKIISQVVGKPIHAIVWYGGVLDLEIGELIDTPMKTPEGKTFISPTGEFSLVIEGDWVLSSKGGQIYGSDYLNNRDAGKVENFFDNAKIEGVDTVEKMKVFSFILGGNKEINVTGTSQDFGGYFYLSSRDETESVLELSSEFKFKKNTPR